VHVRDAPILLKLCKNIVLDGNESFSQPFNSAIEFDESALAFTDGYHLVTWMLDVGSSNVVFPENFNIFGETIILKADGTPGNMYSLVAQSLEPGNTADVLLSVTTVDII